MSKHLNLVTAQKLWTSIAAGDVEALARVISADCVWVMPGSSELAGEYTGRDEAISLMARVGELCDQLKSDLLDIYVNDRGSVLRYSLHATRGDRAIETEHLFRIEVDRGVITKAVFVPIDQSLYDAFWAEEVAPPGEFKLHAIVNRDQR